MRRGTVPARWGAVALLACRAVRVLHVAEGFGGGLLGIVQMLVEAGVEHGHDVVVGIGVRPETPPELTTIFPRSVRVEVLWQRRAARQQLPAMRRLRALVREIEPDVVHLHSSFAGLAGSLALGRRPPVIYTPHGYAFERSADSGAKRSAYRAAEMWVARRCALVAAVSDPEAAVARTVVRAPRVATIRNGIPELDPEHLPEPQPERDLGVVAFGRVTAQRRPVETVRILEGVRDIAPVTWIGAAPGPEAELVRPSGIPVTGWLEREAAMAMLGRSIACVHWSGWDGAALSILEALAHDVVVVASDIPANRAILGEAQVRSSEAEAVALLRRVVLEPEYRDALLERQRSIRAAFGRRTMTDAWMGLYERVAGRHPSTSAR